MRTTLRLTLDVTYDDDDEITTLRDNLMDLATLAMREGLLTADTGATVFTANPSVEVLA